MDSSLLRSRELLRRLRAPQAAATTWTLPPAEPQERQRALLDCEADEALYGGAVGGGKSWALLRAAIEYIHGHPGASVLLVRQTYPQLSQAGGLIPLSQEMLRGVARYNESRHRWTFPCGGVLQFGYCSGRADYTQYLGSEYEWIGYDEATQLPTDAIAFINSRCRSARGYPTRLRYCSNPGGVSGAWFRQEFVEPGEAEGGPFTVKRVVAGVQTTVRRQYIPSRLDDNRYLDKEAYLVSLSGLPEPLVQSLVEGRWDVLAGQYYGEFSRLVHVVAPFEVPSHWRVYVGIDYGYNNPCGVVWGAADTDGNLWVVRELRIRLKEVDEVAALIQDINAEQGWRPVRYGAGPDLAGMSKRTRGGPSDEEAFKRAGLPIDTQVAPGALGKRHKFGNARRYLRWRGEDGKLLPGRPRLRVFDTCPTLIAQIQEAMIDPDDPEAVLDNPADSEGRGGDDVRDAWEYLLMCRPIASSEPRAALVPGTKDYILENRRRAKRGLGPLPMELGPGQ